MPVCHVCDAVDDFHVEDGLYYCNICSTQSQSMQVLEQEDPYAGVSSGRSSMSHSMLGVKVSAKPRKEFNIELTKSKPWWSYEAFQIILQAQIESLIALGVSKHLSEIVKKIWFKYLQQSGVAFCSTSKEQMSAYRKMAEERELEVLVRADAKKQARRKRLAGSSNNVAVEDDETSAESEWLESELETEEYLSSEAPDSENDALSVKSFCSAESAHSSASSCSHKSGCSDRNTVHIRKRNKSNDEPLVAIISLKHLVCFLYLGLRYISEPIIMNDLIRWINNGLLPYFGTENLLPKDMVASMGTSERRQFLNRDVPSLLKFEKLWRSLTTFLNIKNLPPVDSRLLIARFVLDLNLPKELLAMTHSVIHHKNACKGLVSKKKGRQMNHPYCEVEALAIIAVTLKSLFHLEDDFEHKQSQICRKIQKCCDAGSNYFVWDEWVLAQNLKLREQQQDIIPTNPGDVLKLMSLESLIDFEKNTYKKWLGGETSYQAWSSNKMETRMEMKKPFVALSDNKDAVPKNVPSTFINLLPCQDSSLNNVEMRDCGVSYYMSKATLSKDFSVTSLTYIVKPEIVSPAKSKHSRTSGESLIVGNDLLEDYDEVGLSVSQKHHDMLFTQQKNRDLSNVKLMSSDSLDSIPPTTDEENTSLSPSMLQSRSKIDTRDGMNGSSDKTGERSTKYIKQDLPVIVKNTDKKHTCIRLHKKLTKMSRNQLYIIYPKLTTCTQTGFDQQVRRFHYSYDWLIRYLSRMVGKEFNELHNEVCELEKALCLDKQDVMIDDPN